MRAFYIFIAVMALLVFTQFVHAAPYIINAERLAISSDGNANDCDDVSATALTIGLLAKTGNANKLKYYGYNDHIWGNKSGPCGSASQRPGIMTTSAEGTAQKFGGFDMNVFYSAVQEKTAAVNALATQIKVSTATNRLIIIGAGPMEVIIQAYKKAIADGKKSSIQYTQLVSHSLWNETYKLSSIRSLAEINRQLCVPTVKIEDQNGPPFVGSKAYFAWMNNSPYANVKWLYSRGLAAKLKNTDGTVKMDYSDAGMTYYVLTGKVSNNANAAAVTKDLRAIFGS